MDRQIELIGAAWGLGGADPGCAQAPAALAPLLVERLARCGARAMPGPILEPSPSERRRQLAVSKLCGLLASAVADSLRHGRLPCVLGGDHSCAGGTWTGVARALNQRELGLIWVDAHMDSHTPRTSPTGRLHGMPLAWLLGQDDDLLYGLAAGVVHPRHVALVGVRSFEPEEAERLGRLGVRVFHMDEVRSRGLDAVMDDAFAIAASQTAGFGVSIDLDVVTPEDAPGVATPAAGGIGGAELARALARIGGRPDLMAVELVEYCPRLDRDGRSARVAVEALAAALCGARYKAHVVAEAIQRHDS
ncbi:MAG TPA: arginase [Burkholderiales bacterium]|jgi:arginase|nr:arginase [Burkholderiales bacterium]